MGDNTVGNVTGGGGASLNYTISFDGLSEEAKKFATDFLYQADLPNEERTGGNGDTYADIAEANSLVKQLDALLPKREDGTTDPNGNILISDIQDPRLRAAAEAADRLSDPSGKGDGFLTQKELGRVLNKLCFC
jgi:hypothetical protein